MKKATILFHMLLVVSLVATAQDNSYKVSSIPFPLVLENKAKSVLVKNNEIIMTAGANTDMFRDPNVTYNTDNAPKLLFQPDQDFVLTVAIEHSFKYKWDGGAIVIKADSMNWVKFCFEKDYLLKRRVVSVVTKNVSDDCNSLEIAGNKVFYKMAKADNVITLYCSTDNKNWFLVRHLQMDLPKSFQIGFLAQSPTGKECRVRFSSIKYVAKKIKDPYAGE